MQVATSDDDLMLPDGTWVRAGDRVIKLHLWNEQVPLFPRAGPTLGWARRMSRAFSPNTGTTLRRRAPAGRARAKRFDGERALSFDVLSFFAVAFDYRGGAVWRDADRKPVP
jgi:hypothetical protein